MAFPPLQIVPLYVLFRGGESTGSSIGGVIFILTIQAFIPKVGFAWSARVMAFIMLLCKYPCEILRINVLMLCKVCALWNLFVRSMKFQRMDTESWRPSLKIFKSPTLSVTAASERNE